MRTQHDSTCQWYRDWFACDCGYLEEEVRNERKHLTASCVAYEEGSGCEDCLDNTDKNKRRNNV